MRNSVVRIGVRYRSTDLKGGAEARLVRLPEIFNICFSTVRETVLRKAQEALPRRSKSRVFASAQGAHARCTRLLLLFLADPLRWAPLGEKRELRFLLRVCH